MRDVLGNMEELASDYGLRTMGGEFAILAIERAEAPRSRPIVTSLSPTRSFYSATLIPFARVAPRVT